MSEDLIALARRARVAARSLAATGPDRKDAALRAMASRLQTAEADIMAANAADLAAAKTDDVDVQLVKVRCAACATRQP